MKKCALATIAGFVVMFLLSYVWYELLMAGFYKEQSYMEPRAGGLLHLYIGLGYLVLALLMAYIYPKGYSSGTPAREGAIFGVLVGLLWILPYSLVLYGVYSTGTRALIAIDALWHVVEQGIGGLAIAAVYGRGADEAAGDDG